MGIWVRWDETARLGCWAARLGWARRRAGEDDNWQRGGPPGFELSRTFFFFLSSLLLLELGDYAGAAAGAMDLTY